MRLVGTMISLHSMGRTYRVTRVSLTYGVNCRVRATTVHLYGPKVGRRCVTKMLSNVTTSCKDVASFTAVLARRKRALRGRSRDRVLRPKHVVLASTKTREIAGCYSSRAHAMPIKNGFRKQRGSICGVMLTYRSGTLRVAHPNVACVSMRLRIYGILIRKLGSLKLVGNGIRRTITTNTRTLFLPRKLNRVVKLSMRSVRSLKRVCMKCSSRVHPSSRFKLTSLHVKHHLRRNFIVASRPNYCFVPTLVSG